MFSHASAGPDVARSRPINKGITPIIRPNPTSANRSDDDRHLDEERHLVEVVINRLKQVRRLAKSIDKTATTYLAMLQIGCAWSWTIEWHD